MYHDVLYCIVLYYVVMYYSILYYVLNCSIMLWMVFKRIQCYIPTNSLKWGDIGFVIKISFHVSKRSLRMSDSAVRCCGWFSEKYSYIWQIIWNGVMMTLLLKFLFHVCSKWRGGRELDRVNDTNDLFWNFYGHQFFKL